MFELSVARKYLTPRWRQLSVSIISLISMIVIALVVWLIVVFFSVTNGLEKSWIDKLIALTAPVRVTPTDAYYRSFYYQVDSISADSDYNLKNIKEKLKSLSSNPYDPNSDEEIPFSWPKPDLDAKGNVKDIVKLAFQAIQNTPNLKAKDFEMTGGNLNLRLLRNVAPQSSMRSFPSASTTISVLTQPAYFGSFDPDNGMLSKSLLPLAMSDLTNLFSMIAVAADNQSETNSDLLLKAPKDLVQSRLRTFFSAVTVQELMTPETTWTLPRQMLPEEALWQAYALYKGNRLVRIILTTQAPALKDENIRVEEIKLKIEHQDPYLIKNGEKPQPLPKNIPIAIPSNFPLQAQLDHTSILEAETPFDVLFDLHFSIQGQEIKGRAPMGNLLFHKAMIAKSIEQNAEQQPLWVYSVPQEEGFKMELPSDPFYGDGIILPRPFREAGVSVGDRGYLAYAAPTTSSVQEQRIPVFVAGFYEPGIIPIGGKFILVNQQVTSLIRSSQNQEDTSLSNGINIRFDDIQNADQVKVQLQQAFKEAGIAPYWKIETYRDYDFTKDLIQQLRSEKNLFSLLATIIIIVACSNIISMLIILVNDKKLEIGILRSMGASSLSIAIIFGTCGMIMGVAGSLLGTFAAVITLKNLQPLINLISRIQGYEMFNPLFFGDTLPTELSFEALIFVVLATALISLIAGLVPAIKASLMKPSTILRSE
jgi:lipoprotein-releasing system permease protein